MIDGFSPKNELLIWKYMPQFAAIETKRARKRWGQNVANDVKVPKPVQKGGGRKMVKSPVSKETGETVAKMRVAGKTQKEIADATGCSIYGVQKHLATQGIDHMARGLMPERARKVFDLLQDGKSPFDIGWIMNIKHSVVMAYIDEYNLIGARPNKTPPKKGSQK